MTQLSTAIAEEIRAEAARRKLSGREVARRAHIPFRTVARRMADGKGMTLEEVDAIAHALDMSPVELISQVYAKPALDSAEERIHSLGGIGTSPYLTAVRGMSQRSATTQTQPAYGHLRLVSGI